MVSALTMRETDETPDGRARWSYILLAETLRRISERPADDARELFGRMVFNALVSNTDDRPRNHAAFAPGSGWRLSPAYDLTPAPAVAEERRDLAMACGAQGRYANAANVPSECRGPRLPLSSLAGGPLRTRPELPQHDVRRCLLAAC